MGCCLYIIMLISQVSGPSQRVSRKKTSSVNSPCRPTPQMSRRLNVYCKYQHDYDIGGWDGRYMYREL